MSQIRPFHATIIAGAPEQRRAKALELAQALVCEGAQTPCHSCRHCQKAAQGIHPDIIPVEQFMEEKDMGTLIKVDAVRALRSDAAILPNEAHRKVYVIDNAQTMNPNGQNALLKLLEEGPPYAAFLLLCDSAGALLETIRSRCAVISAGREQASLPVNDQALAFVRVLAQGNELQRAAFLAKLELTKPDKPTLDSFFTGLEGLLQDAAVGGVTGRFACPESEELARRVDRKKLLDGADKVRQAREMMVFHVGAGHILGWLGSML